VGGAGHVTNLHELDSFHGLRDRGRHLATYNVFGDGFQVVCWEQRSTTKDLLAIRPLSPRATLFYPRMLVSWLLGPFADEARRMCACDVVCYFA